MLSRLVVGLYAWIFEICLWFMLLISGVIGYYYAVPMLDKAGLIPEHEIVWRIFGALFFALAAFLVSAVIFGPILVLVDIGKSVRSKSMWCRGVPDLSGHRGLPAGLHSCCLHGRLGQISDAPSVCPVCRWLGWNYRT
jgi:hypothetical protein